MTPQVVLQNLVFGLFVGGIYGVAAVGLTLIFGVMRILNVAHGELLMIGGYVAYWLFTLWGIDPFLSVALAAGGLFLVGLALDAGLFRFVQQLEPEQRTRNSLLISFGLALVIQSLALQLWTADERSVTVRYAGGGFSLLGIVFPYTRLATLVTGVLVVLALGLVLRRTDFGRAIRATAIDWEAAALAGIDVRRVYLVTFGIGAALAGVAGALVSVGYSVSPNIGSDWTLKSLVVVVLAGMGSVYGALAAGLLLGAAEGLSTTVVPSEYREVVGLVLFLLVLLFRPQGLFGRRES
ncbi:MAG: branched-chain amino acid ABC transporter permease [Chloroflexi bacterium]|nr:branched-chain amino acid ABC transporter permease [Chloroflexota bacterium]